MRLRYLALLAIGAIELLGARAIAQSSAYYVTDGTTGVGYTHIWQGGVMVGQYKWGNLAEMPIVVGNFGSGIRVRQSVGEPIGPPLAGDEYLLDGTTTGFHNLWDPGNTNITGYDAAFDGSWIYMVDWGGPTSGEIYRYDNNYGGRTAMFMANTGDIGITYDSRDETLWTANFNNGLVSEWTMSGTLVTSFTARGGSAAALAFDSIDGTLWMSDGSHGQNILNYTTSGQLVNVVKTGEYILGGEMTAAPEPASLALFGCGIVALLRRRSTRL